MNDTLAIKINDGESIAPCECDSETFSNIFTIINVHISDVSRCPSLWLNWLIESLKKKLRYISGTAAEVNDIFSIEVRQAPASLIKD